MNPLKSARFNASQADGSLIGLLTAAFYVLFTLLPGSSTYMVEWPWVFLWQVTLLLPIIWMLWQLWFKPVQQLRLGGGLDWIVLLAVVGLGVSTLWAEFPNQALWNSWATLGGIAALYSLKGWMTTPQRVLVVLKAQGILAIAFIVLSLGLWIGRIYLPELSRLNVLSQYGIEQTFSFNYTSLRNWQPIGHQNSVAGYLVLVLPLLVVLAATSKGVWRWLWVVGSLLGLVDLYTTSSRGGWLGLLGVVAVGFIISLIRSSLPRKVLIPTGLASLGALVSFMLLNERIRGIFAAIASGNFRQGEFAYRIITNTVGWNMGKAQPLTGIGPGSVPIVYQKYLPVWGGREAELQYQLHSTPAQLWGELGVWGVMVPALLAGWLLFQYWRWQKQPDGSQIHPWLVWSLGGGLFAYSLVSLTDYQLDIIAISGVIVVYLAVLSVIFQTQTTASAVANRLNRSLAGIGLGITLAMTLWLVPVHRAWMISAQGFDAYNEGNLDLFAYNLEKAHQMVPWESYYPFQFGWRVGDISYSADTPEQAIELRSVASEWFQKGIEASPYQEFGYSNLGWLQIQADPPMAMEQFIQSAQLIPVKRGVFFGLGYSLLLQGRQDLAVEALVLELARHPMMITSGVWRLNTFAAIYPEVLARLETLLTELLDTASDPTFIDYLHQVRGGLRWWTGDLTGAAQDWGNLDSPLNEAFLLLSQGETVNVDTLPDGPSRDAIQAWQNPEQRQELLIQAWIFEPEGLPQLDEGIPSPEVLAELQTSMDAATNWDEWLKIKASVKESRDSRLGFNVLARHLDGFTPSDFYPQINNVPMNRFFGKIFPSVMFLPELDLQLQTYRSDFLLRLQN